MRQLVVVLATHVRTYDEISAFSYTVEANGTLTANNPVNDAVLVDFARANDIRVIPTVSSTWDSRNILAMLKDPKLRARHIEAIMKIARSPLIDGIDIDYENLPPEMRQPFTDFIYELSTALHAENKILSVTVPARVRNDDGCQLCAFADYANLGRAADQIRIMAYEYHGKTGGPGPNAPIWWIRQVTDYAITQVPREKIILGIHLYGYDWGGKETPALWWADVQARQAKYGGIARYVASDERGAVGETMLQYNVIVSPRCPPDFYDCAPYTIEKHTVWYVDANYVKLAWQIVNDYGLGGMVMWRPGGEDPAMWEFLEQ
jgi:spore germination protein YaaH